MAELRKCKGCESTFLPCDRERNKRLWCTPACRDRARRRADPAAALAASRRQSAARSARLAALRPGCLSCYGPIQKSGAQFCNAADCQALAKRVRMRERYAANRKAMVERARRNRESMTDEQRSVERIRRHTWRGRVGYIPSIREADQRRRARKIGAEVEDFTNAEIFERDRWVCGICETSVEPSLSWPAPKSASLDHVLPLSKGGNHTRANTRLAHLDCNVRRGNRAESEIRASAI